MRLFKRDDGVVDALEDVIATGGSEWAPRAMLALGSHLCGRGDRRGARRAFSDAIASGHYDAMPKALVELGELLAESGDRDGARMAFLQAVASKHDDAGPRAMFDLAQLFDSEGDLYAARAAYDEAVASGHEIYAPSALVNIALRFDPAVPTEAISHALKHGEPIEMTSGDCTFRIEPHADAHRNGPNAPNVVRFALSPFASSAAEVWRAVALGLGLWVAAGRSIRRLASGGVVVRR